MSIFLFVIRIGLTEYKGTENVSDVLSEGQEIDVKLIGFERGKMKLSAKALIAKEDNKSENVEEIQPEE